MLSRNHTERRLPDSAHTSRPWRVHEIAGDFRLEDVWRLPTPGGPGDLDRLITMFAGAADDFEDPPALRALFTIRWKLGALFGWDEPGSEATSGPSSLRDRLPAELRAGPRGPDLLAVPGREAADGPPVFRSLYRTDDEWVSEYASRTVDALLHIGWVADGIGPGYHGQLAVLVRPEGRLGKAYMAAIKPVRHAVVYPLLLRSVGRQWQSAMREPDKRASGPAQPYEGPVAGPDAGSPA